MNDQCQQCGSKMVLRHRRSDGGTFLGCTKYPACKGAKTVVVVTPELVQEAMTGVGGWTREQLAILGVAWPPPSGWKAECFGRFITPSQRTQLLTIGEARKKKMAAKSAKKTPQPSLPLATVADAAESLEEWRARMIAADTSTEPPFDVKPSWSEPGASTEDIDAEFAAMFR